MILGVDIGTRNTGLAYFEENCIYSSTIKQETNLTGKKSLFEMGEKVAQKILDLKPNLIGFESYGYKKGFVNTDLGELVGIVLYLLRNSGLELIFLSPMTIKKVVTGEGRAKKAAVKKSVKELYAITGDSTHEYDAIAICHTIKMFMENKLESKMMSNFERRKICLKY